MAIFDLFSKKKTPQELLAAGNHKAALKGFLAMLEGKRQDPVVMMNIANIYLKMNKPQEAKKYFVKVGEYYGDQGFFNKAVAAFKKALNITPNDQTILNKLAGYNNKVPKYMLDAAFLAKAAGAATGEKREKTVAESPKAAPTAGDDSHAVEKAPVAEVAKEDIGAVEFDTLETDLTSPTDQQMAEFDTLGQPTSHEPDFSDIDFDTLNEVSNELSEEFERDVQRAAKPDLSEELAKLDELDFQEIDADNRPQYPDMAPPVSQPPAPEPPPVVEEPNTQEQRKESGGIVFSTRSERQEAAGDNAAKFDSYDDALDNLFSGDDDPFAGFGGGADSEPEPAQTRAQEPIMHDDSLDLTGHQHERARELLDDEHHNKHWPLFRTMSDDAFRALIVALRDQDYEPGMPIVVQGDQGGDMFLIAHGEVEVLISKGGKTVKVADLGEGDFFGEASLLTGAPRNATVRAVSETTCLLLSRDEVNKLVKSYPAMRDNIRTIYEARQAQNARS